MFRLGTGTLSIGIMPGGESATPGTPGGAGTLKIGGDRLGTGALVTTPCIAVMSGKGPSPKPGWHAGLGSDGALSTFSGAGDK